MADYEWVLVLERSLRMTSFTARKQTGEDALGDPALHKYVSTQTTRKPIACIQGLCATCEGDLPFGLPPCPRGARGQQPGPAAVTETLVVLQLPSTQQSGRGPDPWSPRNPRSSGSCACPQA